jgi:hypothetical protein
MLASDAAEGEWVLDKEIPIFTQDREYVERCFKVKENEDE